jgi:hypothetical protein
MKNPFDANGILRFPSLAAMAEFYKANCANEKGRSHYHGDSHWKDWTGFTQGETLEHVAKGWREMIPVAQSMLDKIETNIPLDARQLVQTVAGFLPNVPAYLAGHPLSMFKLDDVKSDTAPVRIYVCTTSSCGVTHQDLAKRGAAVLALCMALAQSRPVELYTFTALDGNQGGKSCCVVRLNSAPLDLGECCAALCHTGIDRIITHGIGDLNGFTGGWARGANAHDCPQVRELYRGWLGASSTDLVLGSAYYGDPLINHPVQWVQETLKKYTADIS